MDDPIKQISANYALENDREKRLRKFLPFLLLLSFIWLYLYESLNGITQISVSSDISVSISVLLSFLFSCGIAYLSFEIMFFVYRFILAFSIYTYVVPKQVFQNRFRLWFVVRNVLLGIVFNLCFIFPYISQYLVVIEILFNFLFIICFFFSISTKYVDPLIRHFLFRIVVLWVLIYEVIEALILVVRVL